MEDAKITQQDLREALSTPPEPRRRPAVIPGADPAEQSDEPRAPEPAWDWSTELAEHERAELVSLRATGDELRDRLEHLESQVKEGAARERELRAALAQLAAAKGFQRRRVLAELRARALL